MSRFGRQILLFLGLSLIVTLIRFPYEAITTDLFRNARSKLLSQGIILNASSVEPRLPLTLSFKELSVLLKAGRYPFPLFFDSAVFSVELLPLLLLRTSFVFEGDFYGGSASARYLAQFLSADSSVQLLLSHARLSGHPVLRGLGIEGGLSLDTELELPLITEDKEALADQKPKGKLTLSITDGMYRGGHSIRGLITLPEIKDIQLEMLVKKTGNLLVVSRGELFSSMGQVSLSGEVKLEQPAERSRLDLVVKIHLTSAGVESFGGYLALLAKAPVEQPPRSYILEIQKSEFDLQPKLNARPLG